MPAIVQRDLVCAPRDAGARDRHAWPGQAQRGVKNLRSVADGPDHAVQGHMDCIIDELTRRRRDVPEVGVALPNDKSWSIAIARCALPWCAGLARSRSR